MLIMENSGRHLSGRDERYLHAGTFLQWFFFFPLYFAEGCAEEELSGSRVLNLNESLEKISILPAWAVLHSQFTIIWR